jgi:hypothetical protein
MPKPPISDSPRKCRVAQQHAIGLQALPKLLPTRSFGRPRLRQAGEQQHQAENTAASGTAQNTARQPKLSISTLPVSGARIGDTLNTSISSDISRAASLPVCRSRTTARGTTMPAQAPRPCTKRSAISASIWAPARSRCCRREQRQAEIQRRLAAHHVRHRPVDHLAERRARRRTRSGWPAPRPGWRPAPARWWAGRQVHVDGEGADGGDQAQHQRLDGPRWCQRGDRRWGSSGLVNSHDEHLRVTKFRPVLPEL